MDKKLLEIINHYGIKAQLKYLYSELYELTEVIIRAVDCSELFCNLTRVHKMLLTDELADVHVLLR